MDDPVRHHIAAVAAGGAAGQGRLARRLMARWTPDRSEPGAVGWVRRWRPVRAGVALPGCSCAAGRCAVCN